MDKSLLKIDHLYVSVKDKDILKGFNLDVKPGELHVIMGRNGTGKSTLANILAGKENYLIKKGSIIKYIPKNKKDLNYGQKAQIIKITNLLT